MLPDKLFKSSSFLLIALFSNSFISLSVALVISIIFGFWKDCLGEFVTEREGDFDLGSS